MIEIYLKKLLSKENIPNTISLFRIILILPIIILLELGSNLTWFLLIIASISDFFDGYLAKKLKLESSFGAIIDPLADKIFIVILFAWLCINNVIPFWSFSIIILREFTIASFRSTKTNGLPANKVAKLKTLFQFISLIFLFFPLRNELIMNMGLIFYWAGFILCICSFINYLKLK